MLGFQVSPVAVSAQQAESTAKAYFEQGRRAFEAGRFVDALHAFKTSYHKSGRGELHYNIALTADRLRRDEEALAAYQAYLRDVENPALKADVEARIRELSRVVNERKQEEAELVRARLDAIVAEEVPSVASASLKNKRSAGSIAGPVVLGTVGLAGVTAMIVGIAKNGNKVAGSEFEERKTKPFSYVIGALGVAAIGGAVAWFVLSKPKPNGQKSAVIRMGLGLTGLKIDGRF